jgi:uncharacterized protein YggE
LWAGTLEYPHEAGREYSPSRFFVNVYDRRVWLLSAGPPDPADHPQKNEEQLMAGTMDRSGRNRMKVTEGVPSAGAGKAGIIPAAILFSLAAFLTSVNAGPASAQATPGAGAGPGTIRVSGVGEVRVKPDMSTVNFAVETTGATAREASEANSNAMDAVVRALRGAGVTSEEISTSGYSLYPEYAMQTRDDPDATPRIRGYRASNQLSVRTRSIDSVGRLIDTGLGAGANRLNGVSFELVDSRAAETEALSRAVQAARTSAETIATALGVRLGRVLDASTSSQPAQPFYMQRDMAFAEMSVMAAAAPTPIQVGEQNVYASASVVFEIE